LNARLIPVLRARNAGQAHAVVQAMLAAVSALLK